MTQTRRVKNDCYYLFFSSDGEKVIWGHKNGQTETFYQAEGTSRPGLPIPSDVMARIPHRAKRRLERDHGITIL